MLGEEDSPLPNMFGRTMKYLRGSRAMFLSDERVVDGVGGTVGGWENDDVILRGIQSAMGLEGKLGSPKRRP